MAERLKDKVAIVTGAGSVGPGWGNGKAASVLFAREGAKVFCVDLNIAAKEEVPAATGVPSTPEVRARTSAFDRFGLLKLRQPARRPGCLVVGTLPQRRRRVASQETQWCCSTLARQPSAGPQRCGRDQILS